MARDLNSLRKLFSGAPLVQGGVAWDPSQGFAGGPLVLWVRGDGLVADGSGNASAWTDRSGAGLYAPVQSNSGARPAIVTGGLGGQSCAAFTGSQFLKCGAYSLASLGLSLFAVATATVDTAVLGCLVGRQGASDCFGIVSDTDGEWGFYLDDVGGWYGPYKVSGDIRDGQGYLLGGTWSAPRATITSRMAGSRILWTQTGSRGVALDDTSDQLTIGGAYGAGGSGGNFVNANVYEVFVVAGELTTADMAKLGRYVYSRYGVPSWNEKVMFVGDSLTAGYGLPGFGMYTYEGPGAIQTPWPQVCLAALGRSYGIPTWDYGNSMTPLPALAFNLGYPGNTTAEMLEYIVDGGSGTSGVMCFDAEVLNAVFVLGLVNDINYAIATSVGQALSNLETLYAAIRAKAGSAALKLVGCTLPDCNYPSNADGTYAFKHAIAAGVNAFMQNPANWATLGIDALCDFAACPQVGPLGQSQTSYFQGDGIHPSVTGHAAMGAFAAAAI